MIEAQTGECFDQSPACIIIPRLTLLHNAHVAVTALKVPENILAVALHMSVQTQDAIAKAQTGEYLVSRLSRNESSYSRALLKF